MKLLTQKEEDEHQEQVVKGGIHGFFGGLAVSTPIFYVMSKRNHWYRTLPIPLKAFGFVMTTVPPAIICAESYGVKYEQSLWKGAGKAQMDLVAQRKLTKWDHMTTSERIKDWSMSHKWSLLGGGWLASMVGSFAYVARGPETTQQKVVQARMIAQFLTLILLGGSAYLSYDPAQAGKRPEPDHTWADVLKETEKEEQYMAEERKAEAAFLKKQHEQRAAKQ